MPKGYPKEVKCRIEKYQAIDAKFLAAGKKHTWSPETLRYIMNCPCKSCKEVTIAR